MFEANLPNALLKIFLPLYSSLSRMKKVNKAFELSMTHSENGQITRSLKYIDLAVLFDEFSDSEILLQKVHLLFLNRKTKSAFKLLEQIKIQTGNSIECQMREATLYIQLQKANQALELLKNTVKENPCHSDVHNQLGFAYYLLKDYPNALYYLNLAIEYNTDNMIAWENKALVHLDYDKDLMAVNRCIYQIKKQTIRSPHLYKIEGMLLKKQGRYEEAIDTLFVAKDLGCQTMFGDDVDKLIEEMQMILQERVVLKM